MKFAETVTLRRRRSGVSGFTTSGGRGGGLVPAGTANATSGAGGNARTTSLGTGLGLYSTARNWASSASVVAHGAAKNPTQRRKGAKIFFSKTYLCALAPRV